MTTVEVLRAARELIGKGWTQGTYARNAGGNIVSYDSPNAVCWCSLGALHATTDVFRAFASARDALENVVGRGVVGWNDTADRTQAEVVAAFDRAIATEEANANRA